MRGYLSRFLPVGIALVLVGTTSLFPPYSFPILKVEWEKPSMKFVENAIILNSDSHQNPTCRPESLLFPPQLGERWGGEGFNLVINGFNEKFRQFLKKKILYINTG
ncbi:TPA: hypothetical protein IAD52_02415 [Candidatus Spyradomonas excrementavium]|nr:hypothetical protein [Candidatus Spyradomonas excrementavium]